MGAKPIRFKILVKKKNNFFHLGDISINSLSGEIYYFQSNCNTVGENSMVKAGETVHHISFKKDGAVHAKSKTKKKYPGPRFTPIEDIKNQLLFFEEIGNIEELPVVKNSNDTDYTFELMPDWGVGIILEISIVSESRGNGALNGVKKNHTLKTKELGLSKKCEDRILEILIKPGNATPPGTNRRAVMIPILN